MKILSLFGSGMERVKTNVLDLPKLPHPRTVDPMRELSAQISSLDNKVQLLGSFVARGGVSAMYKGSVVKPK